MTTTTVSTVQSPRQVIEAFGNAINSGDLEGALALYQPDAAFLPQPGQAVHGIPAIREALQGLLTAQPHISGEFVKVVEAGDAALVVYAWTMHGTQPDGAPMSLSGRSADVLQRQADGTWAVAIDDPWGSSA